MWIFYNYYYYLFYSISGLLFYKFDTQADIFYNNRRLQKIIIFYQEMSKPIKNIYMGTRCQTSNIITIVICTPFDGCKFY